MRQTRKATRMRILPFVALAAVLILTLAACQGSPSAAQSNPPDASISPTATPADSSAPEGGSLLQDTPILPIGYLEGSGETISDEDGNEISREIEEMQKIYRGDPSNPAVKPRDWSIYTSRLAKENLPSAEAAFYDRLDELCLKYLANDALDGVHYEGYSGYATDAAQFSDLGLDFDRAADVFWWFKYNNPQYYFLTGTYLNSSQSLFPKLYDFLADAEERAKITNELFDKLDGWIKSIDGEGTTWQKELAANNLLCKHIVYNKAYADNKDRLGQTLYTAVVNQSTVCAGYAMAYCAMMNASGIETVVALSPTHAWNVGRFDDGNYYAVDVTWNDNKYDDDNPYNRYFNAGEKTMKSDDSIRAAHTYRDDTGPWTPVISQENYAPTAYDTSAKAIKLSKPENITVITDESTVTSFSWDPVEGADQYHVALFLDDTCKEIWVDSMLRNTSTGEGFSSLQPGSTYYYGVRAVKTVSGVNHYSDWTYFSHTTPSRAFPSAAPSETLAAPGDVFTMNLGVRTTLWLAVPEATGYQVCVYSDETRAQIAQTQSFPGNDNTQTTWEWANLAPDTTYYCAVRSVKAIAGGEVYSDWFDFTLE